MRLRSGRSVAVAHTAERRSSEHNARGRSACRRSLSPIVSTSHRLDGGAAAWGGEHVGSRNKGTTAAGCCCRCVQMDGGVGNRIQCECVSVQLRTRVCAGGCMTRSQWDSGNSGTAGRAARGVAAAAIFSTRRQGIDDSKTTDRKQQTNTTNMIITIRQKNDRMNA